MKKTIRSVVSTGLLTLSAIGNANIASAATTLNPFEYGWYDSRGASLTDSDNYGVGDEIDTSFIYLEYRNWFAFDLSGISSISSATLRAYNIGSQSGTLNGFVSPDLSETWTLLDVTTNVIR